MSLVQAGASKETMCSFGRTLSQNVGRYWGMSCYNSAELEHDCHLLSYGESERYASVFVRAKGLLAVEYWVTRARSMCVTRSRDGTVGVMDLLRV